MNLPYTIPQEVLDRIDALDGLISQGEYPEGFSNRYKVFKEWMTLSGFDTRTALFVYLNREVLDGINEWEDNTRLMQALEFEYRKEKESRRKCLDEMVKHDQEMGLYDEYSRFVNKEFKIDAQKQVDVDPTALGVIKITKRNDTPTDSK